MFVAAPLGAVSDARHFQQTNKETMAWASVLQSLYKVIDVSYKHFVNFHRSVSSFFVKFLCSLHTYRHEYWVGLAKFIFFLHRVHICSY